MRQHRQRRHQAEPEVRHKGRCNQHAIAKTMHAVTGQHRPATDARRAVVVVRVIMGVMAVVVPLRFGVLVVFMAVVPKLDLVQQKEEHQTNQQRCAQGLGTDMAFKRLGQQVHECGRQQRAGRQAQQMAGVARHQRHAQQRGQPDAANACGQRGQEDRKEGHQGGARKKKAARRRPGSKTGLYQATPCWRNHSSARFQPSLAATSR